MKVVAKYDFNGCQAAIKNKYSKEYDQIVSVIDSIDSALFSPMEITKAFEKAFLQIGWSNHKVNCDYQYGDYLKDYIQAKGSHVQPLREMDFVKPRIKLGIEMQFKENRSMIYSGCAKMTIFNKMGVIDTGIEIVPVKRFADEMSTGVSYFEQFAWDLHHRGESNIDIPVLILGVDA